MMPILKADKFGQLGFYCGGVNAFLQGTISLISAPIIRKIGGIKKSIILAAFIHTTYTAAMILPAEEHRNDWNEGWLHTFTYGLLIVAPTCNGFSAGFLWVC